MESRGEGKGNTSFFMEKCDWERNDFDYSTLS